jgi:hypothetical protein
MDFQAQINESKENCPINVVKFCGMNGGEWYVNDNSCVPNWGDIKDDGCVSFKKENILLYYGKFQEIGYMHAKISQEDRR